VRGELRAHTRAIGALHEDQVALRQEMRRCFAPVDQRFSAARNVAIAGAVSIAAGGQG
jgi:hypothetical protein